MMRQDNDDKETDEGDGYGQDHGAITGTNVFLSSVRSQSTEKVCQHIERTTFITVDTIV